LRYVSSKIPEIKMFIGRDNELEKLRTSTSKLVIVSGIHGVGKTYLVATYLRRYVKAITYWLNASSNDTVEEVVKRSALFFSGLGFNRLSNYLELGGKDLSIISDIISDTASSLNVYMVIDDYHKISDPRLKELIILLAKKLVKGKLIVISRRLPIELISSIHNYLHIDLRGLKPKESVKLLKSHGIVVSNEIAASIYSSTQGHPLLLKMLIDVANKYGVKEAIRAINEGDLYRSLWRRINSSLTYEEREILSILACIDEAVALDLLSSLVSTRHLMKHIYSLADMSLVEDLGGVFKINDLIKLILINGFNFIICYSVFKELLKNLNS